MANFVVLAMATYPSDPTTEENKELANVVFYFIFMLEMIIKMCGNGFKLYFRNAFNVFDFIVIIVSSSELLMDHISTNSAVSFQAIRALRVFRLLRMFKLAKFWTSFNNLINLLFALLKMIIYLTSILILFWFSFAILGKELFSYKLSFTETGVPIKDDYDFEKHVWRQGSSPEFNFDNFLQSVTSVFFYFTVDGWNSILQNSLRMSGINPLLSVCFFFTLYIMGNMVIY